MAEGARVSCPKGGEKIEAKEFVRRAKLRAVAEPFMLFVKHKRKIPAKFAKKPAIRKKWKAVAEIVKRVAAATR